MAREKSAAALRGSVQRYGKQAFTEKEQISILYFMLEDAKDKLEKDSEIYKLIGEYQLKLKDKRDLKETIRIVNGFVIDLEAKDQNGTTVNYLKRHGFYRILYHNPQIMGEELPSDDSLHKLLRNGFIGVAVSALIISLFSATAFFAAPFWFTAIVTGLFIGASTYLSGILYGVINDLFATRANLPYFLLGHQFEQKSLLRTNDKAAQGIAWGVAAAFGPVMIAAIVFTVVATSTAFFVPMATFLLPLMVIAMPLIAVGAEFYARKKAREYIEQDVEDRDELLGIGANAYQRNGLDYMCPTKLERAAWLANSDRNMFGFTKVPLIALGTLVGLITLSAVSMFLPHLLFASPLIAIAIPAIFSTLACVTLIVAGVYMYVNRNKQVDDRYRLEFDRAELEPNLYFDHDMAYVQKLVKMYDEQKPSTEFNPAASDSSANRDFIDKGPVSKISQIPQENREDENRLVYG